MQTPVLMPCDRPAGPNFQTRSQIVCRNGAVAASQPLAAQTGLDILKAGGNAMDAAIATNAMLGLTEPMSCGIGGDIFCLYWEAATNTLHGYNGSGRSPATLTRDVFTLQGLASIPEFGVHSWSVPGCVAGWDDLRSRFGIMSLRDILAPAIQLADIGFAVTPVIAHYWQNATEALAQDKDSATTFLPGGRAPRCGEVFRNPALADSYRQIAAAGPAGFYQGDIAEQIAGKAAQAGGHLSQHDLQAHVGEWVQPVSVRYRDYDVWQLPPNGQGLAVLQMLQILNGYDIADMGRLSADYLHLLIEAKKLAYADRAAYYADPQFSAIPVTELISTDYAHRQRARIHLHQAATRIPPGDPRLDRSDTVYLTVVDADRNCCSLIQSNYMGFGSKVTAGTTGFAMQNRGCLFALDDTHPNRLEPGKRPFHTIIPGFVTRADQPHFCFGVMGGDMQPQGQVQVLVNHIDFQLNIQAAGDAPRIRHIGSATPTGQPADKLGGAIATENGIPQDILQSLTDRGHQLTASPGTFGGYQGILVDSTNHTLQAATESRNDGLAVGY